MARLLVLPKGESHSSEEEPCGDIIDHHELQSIEGVPSSSSDKVSIVSVQYLDNMLSV